jgi:hypothetical protein
MLWRSAGNATSSTINQAFPRAIAAVTTTDENLGEQRNHAAPQTIAVSSETPSSQIPKVLEIGVPAVPSVQLSFMALILLRNSMDSHCPVALSHCPVRGHDTSLGVSTGNVRLARRYCRAGASPTAAGAAGAAGLGTVGKAARAGCGRLGGMGMVTCWSAVGAWPFVAVPRR